MAESHIAQTVEASAPRAVTGGSTPNRYLLPGLKEGFRSAAAADIMVSFLMESGVRLLVDDLRQAAARGMRIRILTGTYMGITQPEALYMLRRELGDAVDLRICVTESSDAARLHAKSYIFHYADGHTEAFVGSSNMSRSALTDGLEWNYRLDSAIDSQSTAYFCQTFEDLFGNHSVPADDAWLASYAAGWHMPVIVSQILQTEQKDTPTPLFQPRGVQTEALYALEQSRRDGADKGLVQAATGVGKTYLAAFDSLKFDRVLFVAHRQEILSQASRTFGTVRPGNTRGFFNSEQKTTDADIIFASAATLGKERYLSEEYFTRDSFDYVIIDEFHHAVTDQYRRITDYFQPRFLLGLTATPERMDGRNIYELCDYNVPYEISMQTAINRGILSPFHYYGIYDQTDYDSVRYVRGHYDEKALTSLYAANGRRTDLIYRHYAKHRPSRTLGFCCSSAHAEDMARGFRERGVSAAAVHSGKQGPFSIERKAALQQLAAGELDVIFCVDMLNEGVDIPSVDMVMFLRPTESPVVFLQQLGRGLRKSRGKDWLTVLDFIGNYKRADRAPLLLSDSTGSRSSEAGSPSAAGYPDGCIVDFDLETLDLFEHLKRRSETISQRIDAEYRRVRDLLGKRPDRMELFTHMDDAVYSECLRTPRHNPFRHYFRFLGRVGDLTPEERALAGTIAEDFIELLESTSMTRVYKMPILYSLYNGGNIRRTVTDEEVLHAWKQFFAKDRNWKDIDPNLSLEEFSSIPDRQHLKKIRRMPVKHLVSSGKGIFLGEDGAMIALTPELTPWLTNKALAAHMGDILEYRTMDYYRRRYRKSRPLGAGDV